MDIVVIQNFEDLQRELVNANQTFSKYGKTIDIQGLLKSYTNQTDENILTKIVNFLNTPVEDIKDACATSITLKY